MRTFRILPALMMAAVLGTTPVPAAEMTPAQIAEAATPSVVLIRVPNGLGSGFVVSDDGRIVTNIHVIRDAKQATVVAADGREFKDVEVMAVDPLERLVAPKLIGALIALPALTILSSFLTIASAAVISTWQLGVEKAYFLGNVEQWLRPADLYKSVIKAVVFAVIIWITSCWQGMAAGPGPEGVGRATNRAIVIEVLACLVLNVALTAVLYRG